MRGSDQLHDITERGTGTNGGKLGQSILFDFDALSCTTDGQNLNDLIQGIGEGSDDEKTIKKIDGDTVG